MVTSPGFFYLFAGLAVAFSLMVVFKKNPVSNAFSLVMTFFCFAGIYALMEAHLIAALQVLVYAGAVMVLFVFVLMLLNANQPSLDFNRTSISLRISVAALLVVLFVLFVVVFRAGGASLGAGVATREAVAQAGGNTRVISETLFSDYLLPFELTSILMLAAICGVVAIAMRKRKGVT